MLNRCWNCSFYTVSVSERKEGSRSKCWTISHTTHNIVNIVTSSNVNGFGTDGSQSASDSELLDLYCIRSFGVTALFWKFWVCYTRDDCAIQFDEIAYFISTMASDAEPWCFCLICVWINGWENNREVGDLRRYGITTIDISWFIHGWPDQVSDFLPQRGNNTELWYFLWCEPKRPVEWCTRLSKKWIVTELDNTLVFIQYHAIAAANLSQLKSPRTILKD